MVNYYPPVAALNGLYGLNETVDRLALTPVIYPYSLPVSTPIILPNLPLPAPTIPILLLSDVQSILLAPKYTD